MRENKEPFKEKTPTIKNAAAAILCGGKSSRMGFDKAFLPGKNSSTLLLQNAQNLAHFFAELFVVCNSQNRPALAKNLACFNVLDDEIAHIGPLGGICTALKAAKEPWVFVMACDMPFANFALLKTMQAARTNAQVVLCSHAAGQEPLFAFYHKTCLETFLRQIEGKNYRLRAEFENLKVAQIPIGINDAKTAFTNLNTRQDFAQWQSKLQ